MLGGYSDSPAGIGGVQVVETTVDLKDALTPLPDLEWGTATPRAIAVINVNDRVHYQRVVGVGAAMTDTSAWLIHDQLSSAAQTQLMANLFGSRGIAMNVMRIPIGASDFTHTGRPYSYDDLPAGGTDPSLRRFSVAHDTAYILPTIREAFGVDPRLQTIAASWSPPAWMKANDSPSNSADRGRLLPQDTSVFARYLVRFVEAYRAAGVPIDAITPENEPGQRATYPALNLSEQAEATLIADDLAPALRAAGLSTRIYGLDYAWKYLGFAQALVRDRPVRQALAGIAWHCYQGNPSVMDAIHREFAGGDQIETECSGGTDPGPTAELLIASFRNWASAVMLWNLALDPAGGPVEPPDYGCPKCTGVVTIDPRTHTVRYTLDYYELGQFGRFVDPGAQRIASNTFVADQAAKQHPPVSYVGAGLDDVAFQDPDGRDVLLVHDNTGHAIRFAVRSHGRSFVTTLPAEGTATFTW